MHVRLDSSRLSEGGGGLRDAQNKEKNHYNFEE